VGRPARPESAAPAATVPRMEQPSTSRRRPLLRPSIHTELAIASVRPRLRGLSHLSAAVVAVPGAIWWTASVDPGRARLAVAAFAFGMAVMFVCSALLHHRPWSVHTHELLLRLDHTGIYLAISGTGVAIGLLGLGPPVGSLMVAVAVVGAVVGITVEWLPFAPPRGFSNAVYLSLGWLPVALLPWLWNHAGPIAVALLLAGGVFYTVGAIAVGLRRPALWPRWFGYHELFHALVIAAVATHGVLVSRLVAAAT
jgi:hemolysin III